MDVVPESSQQNLVRLAEALARLGAALEPGGATTTLSPAELARRGELKLDTDRGVVHVLTAVEGVSCYLERVPNALTVEVGGRQVMFWPREDLIEMKRRSNRLIDRADLGAWPRPTAG